jgi:hypothetical protein
MIFQGLILLDALSSALKKEKRKEKGEMARVLFSQGRHTLLAVSHQNFSGWLLGTIKSCFKGQSLNFIRT